MAKTLNSLRVGQRLLSFSLSLSLSLFLSLSLSLSLSLHESVCLFTRTPYKDLSTLAFEPFKYYSCLR